jgi:hypothetical protein
VREAGCVGTRMRVTGTTRFLGLETPMAQPPPKAPYLPAYQELRCLTLIRSRQDRAHTAHVPREVAPGGRVLGGPAARTACGGNLSLPWLLLSVVRSWRSTHARPGTAVLDRPAVAGGTPGNR